MNVLERLVRYKAWANDLLFKSLGDASASTLDAPQPIIFGSILRTLNHTYAMDIVWQAHLQSEAHPYTTRNPQECPTFEQLLALQRAVDGWYCAYAAGLMPGEAADLVDFQFIGGRPGRMSREEILLHVVNHATYHRGHVADMMYTANLAPPTTDLPVYLHQ